MLQGTTQGKTNVSLDTFRKFKNITHDKQTFTSQYFKYNPSEFFISLLIEFNECIKKKLDDPNHDFELLCSIYTAITKFDNHFERSEAYENDRNPLKNKYLLMEIIRWKNVNALKFILKDEEKLGVQVIKELSEDAKMPALSINAKYRNKSLIYYTLSSNNINMLDVIFKNWQQLFALDQQGNHNTMVFKEFFGMYVNNMPYAKNFFYISSNDVLQNIYKENANTVYVTPTNDINVRVQYLKSIIKQCCYSLSKNDLSDKSINRLTFIARQFKILTILSPTFAEELPINEIIFYIMQYIRYYNFNIWKYEENYVLTMLVFTKTLNTTKLIHYLRIVNELLTNPEEYNKTTINNNLVCDILSIHLCDSNINANIRSVIINKNQHLKYLYEDFDEMNDLLTLYVLEKNLNTFKENTDDSIDYMLFENILYILNTYQMTAYLRSTITLLLDDDTLKSMYILKKKLKFKNGITDKALIIQFNKYFLNSEHRSMLKTAKINLNFLFKHIKILLHRRICKYYIILLNNILKCGNTIKYIDLKDILKDVRLPSMCEILKIYLKASDFNEIHQDINFIITFITATLNKTEYQLTKNELYQLGEIQTKYNSLEKFHSFEFLNKFLNILIAMVNEINTQSFDDQEICHDFIIKSFETLPAIPNINELAYIDVLNMIMSLLSDNDMIINRFKSKKIIAIHLRMFQISFYNRNLIFDDDFNRILIKHCKLHQEHLNGNTAIELHPDHSENVENTLDLEDLLKYKFHQLNLIVHKFNDGYEGVYQCIFRDCIELIRETNHMLPARNYLYLDKIDFITPIGYDLYDLLETNDPILHSLPLDVSDMLLVNLLRLQMEFKCNLNTKLETNIRCIKYSFADIVITAHEYYEQLYKYKAKAYSSAIRGNLKHVQDLYQNTSFDIWSYDTQSGLNILHYALLSGNRKLIKYLFDEGLHNVYCRKTGQNILHFLIANKKPQLLDMVLNNPDTKHLNFNSMVNQMDVYRQTALHISVLMQCTTSIKILLTNHANIHIKNAVNLSPLEIAITKEYNDIVSTLLEVRGKESVDYFDHIQLAVIFDNYFAFKEILNNEINSLIDECKWLKVIQLIIQHGRINYLRHLKEIGKFDQNFMSDNSPIPPLQLAIKYKQISIVKYLLTLNVKCNELDFNKNYTALHLTVQQNIIEILNLLLGVPNIDVNICNIYEITPLHMAVQNNANECFHALMKTNKCKTLVFDMKKCTPLYYSIFLNYMHYSTVLINRYGESALKWEALKLINLAVAHDNIDTVRLLIETCIKFGSFTLTDMNIDHKTPIYYAIDNDNVEMIKLLIEFGFNINTKYKMNVFTNDIKRIYNIKNLSNKNVELMECNAELPSYYAIMHGKHKAAKYLICEQGVEFNSELVRWPDILYQTSLEKNIVKYLYEYHVNLKDNEISQRARLLEVLKSCLNNCKVTLEIKNMLVEDVKYSELPGNYSDNLYAMIDQNNVEMIKFFINLHHDKMYPLMFDCNSIEIFDLFDHTKLPTELHYTIFSKAVKFQNLYMIKCLLSFNEINLNYFEITNNETESYLNMAIKLNNIEIVKLLLEMGANPNILPSPSSTPLYFAIVENNIPITKLLLKFGANRNQNVSLKKKSFPLLCAVESKNIEIVDILLNADGIGVININSQDLDDNTALHKAATFGYLIITKLLLKHNANVNILNKEGLTAAHVALQHFINVHTDLNNNLHELVHFYFTNYPDVLDNDGNTLINYCASNQTYHQYITEELLEYNIDINVSNKFNKNALHYSVEYKNFDLYKLLLGNGAAFDSINESQLLIALTDATEEDILNLYTTVQSAMNDINFETFPRWFKSSDYKAALNCTNINNETVITKVIRLEKYEVLLGLSIHAPNPNFGVIMDTKYTALGICASKNEFDCFQELLLLGAIYNKFTVDNSIIEISSLTTNTNIINLYETVDKLFKIIEDNENEINLESKLFLNEIASVENKKFRKSVLNACNMNKLTVVNLAYLKKSLYLNEVKLICYKNENITNYSNEILSKEIPDPMQCLSDISAIATYTEQFVVREHSSMHIEIVCNTLLSIIQIACKHDCYSKSIAISMENNRIHLLKLCRRYAHTNLPFKSASKAIIGAIYLLKSDLINAQTYLNNALDILEQIVKVDFKSDFIAFFALFIVKRLIYIHIEKKLWYEAYVLNRLLYQNFCIWHISDNKLQTCLEINMIVLLFGASITIKNEMKYANEIKKIINNIKSIHLIEDLDELSSFLKVYISLYNFDLNSYITEMWIKFFDSTFYKQLECHEINQIKKYEEQSITLPDEIFDSIIRNENDNIIIEMIKHCDKTHLHNYNYNNFVSIMHCLIKYKRESILKWIYEEEYYDFNNDDGFNKWPIYLGAVCYNIEAVEQYLSYLISNGRFLKWDILDKINNYNGENIMHHLAKEIHFEQIIRLSLLGGKINAFNKFLLQPMDFGKGNVFRLLIPIEPIETLFEYAKDNISNLIIPYLSHIAHIDQCFGRFIAVTTRNSNGKSLLQIAYENITDKFVLANLMKSTYVWQHNAEFRFSNVKRYYDNI